MSNGWICIHRQICENEYLWGNKPFARGQAWIDLLLQAHHLDKMDYIKSEQVFLKRGQLTTTIRALADRWGWSRTKISDFLNSLRSMGMAKIESDTKKTVITIVNYDFFQDVQDKKMTKKRHGKDTEKTPTILNNNDNNDNKYIKAIPPSFEDVRAYCEKRNNGIGAQTFIDHYTAVGWVVGKNKPMKDWQAAVRTWENRNKNERLQEGGSNENNSGNPATKPNLEKRGIRL